jgi:hypothetical protein
MDASGSVGGAVVFSRWRGRQYVRRHAVPANPRSAKQVSRRATCAYIGSQYRNLDPADKAAWVAAGAASKITGLNAQLFDASRRLMEGSAPRENPTNPSTAVPILPGVEVTGFSSTSCSFEITPGAVTPGDYCWLVYWKSSLTEGLYDDLRLILPIGVTTGELHGLPAGYGYVGVRGVSVGGDKGALGVSDEYGT